MRSDEIVKFIKDNKNYFPKRKSDFLISQLIECEKINIELLYSIKFISPAKVLTMSVFLGIFGVDRFLVKDSFFGFLKLFTFGGLGLLAVFDWFYISKRVKKINYLNLLSLCYYYKNKF